MSANLEADENQAPEESCLCFATLRSMLAALVVAYALALYREWHPHFLCEEAVRYQELVELAMSGPDIRFGMQKLALLLGNTLSVLWRAVEKAYAHTAEAQGRDFELLSEFTLLHQKGSFDLNCARYSLGVRPVSRRNRLEKWLALE